MRNSCLVPLILISACAWGQEQTDLKQILQRLDRLEEENQALVSEVRQLREELGLKKNAAPAPLTEGQPASPPIDEQLAIQQERIEEHEQGKVGTEHRLPVQLTGMVLFNAFLNGRNSGPQLDPVVAVPNSSQGTGGGTLRQSVLGLKFQGPEIFGGGKVNGSIFMDFFGGSGQSLNQLVRLRVATVDLQWKNTTLTVGQDKPILAPREPESLAQLGISPLTASGNLWTWQPQARLEQRFAFGENSGLRAQIGEYQTDERSNGIPNLAEYTSALATTRPAVQGRFEFWRQFTGDRRIEIAPSFDFSRSHLLGRSIASHAWSVDWLMRPHARFDFSGQFFEGDNVGTIGGLHQGITVFAYNRVRAVHAVGGWAQFQYRPTNRLTLDIYGGQEDDRNSDLMPGAIGKNQTYAANILYRLASNVLGSFEYSQVRTTYFTIGTSLNNHYDLALAYLF